MGLHLGVGLINPLEPPCIWACSYIYVRILFKLRSLKSTQVGTVTKPLIYQ